MAAVNKAVSKAKNPDHDEHPDREELRDKYLKAGWVKKQVYGFSDFIREQGVVGLAVGLTLGTAVTVFVKSIVDNIVNPIIGALLPGGSDLTTKYICLKEVNGACINKLSWGAVVSSLISFIAIAAIVYFIVHGLKLDRLDKKKDKEK
jgi:large conductance mechanosensitive channel